jgi:hypothetical protein
MTWGCVEAWSAERDNGNSRFETFTVDTESFLLFAKSMDLKYWDFHVLVVLDDVLAQSVWEVVLLRASSIWSANETYALKLY